MCGNFGLLRIEDQPVKKSVIVESLSSIVESLSESRKVGRIGVYHSELDDSFHEQVEKVSKNGGVITSESSGPDSDAMAQSAQSKKREFMQLFTDLAALTEFRGGQAGGVSTFEYVEDSMAKPSVARMRCVGRKRYTLAEDMAQRYSNLSTALRSDNSTYTAIGHTRFATSSVNVESELHPHEWTPFHDEDVWRFDATTGRFSRSRYEVGVHITHNGDFNALCAYSQELVNEEVGLWLEKVLHIPNNVGSDSVKIAGMLDLYRVQGRWAAAVRLGWVRSVLQDFSDAFVGGKIDKEAASAMPSDAFWDSWAGVFDCVWAEHINNVCVSFESSGKYQYKIDSKGLKQFETVCVDLIWGFVCGDKGVMTPSPITAVLKTLVKKDWKREQVRAFVHHSVRGFLRGDLYTAVTELMSRSIGSFGCQFHCTMEPGVVCIASKVRWKYDGNTLYVYIRWKYGVVCIASKVCHMSYVINKVHENAIRWKYYMLYAICYMLYAICYMLYAICYMLYAICYMLYAICYMLYAISYMLYAIYFHSTHTLTPLYPPTHYILHITHYILPLYHYILHIGAAYGSGLRPRPQHLHLRVRE
jgi:glutamate synthase domain-containing protein 1